ncbi:MAG: permease [Myxococcota bacterium]
MNFIISILKNFWMLTAEMAPYLLLGFFVGGLLHVFISAKLIRKHMGENTIFSVFKSSLLGIPLPLCSCSVIPVASSLRESGAGKAPVISFFISTPVTGVDSIMATWGILGWFFTLIRVFVSFTIGAVAGILSIIFDKDKRPAKPVIPNSKETRPIRGIKARVKEVFDYGFIQLPYGISGSLLFGLLLGAVITVLIPHGFVQNNLGSNFGGIIISVLIAVPLYVCATGSIPIAAALVFKGFSPGAALAFLLAGPATNMVTILTVKKLLGTKSLVFYLGSVIFGSILAALGFDYLINNYGITNTFISVSSQHQMGLSPVHIISGIILLLLVIYHYLGHFPIFSFLHPQKGDLPMNAEFVVSDMTCKHCQNTIENTLADVDGINSVVVDLNAKTVKVDKDDKVESGFIIKLLKKAGYTGVEKD